MPINEVVVVQVGTQGVSTDNPFPVKLIQEVLKGGTQTLETNASATFSAVVDMSLFTGGSLDATVTGSGNFSIALYGNDTETGTFKLLNQEKSDKSGQEDVPAIVTTADVSKSYSLSNIRAKFLKFVATATGTIVGTFKFTPTKE